MSTVVKGSIGLLYSQYRRGLLLEGRKCSFNRNALSSISPLHTLKRRDRISPTVRYAWRGIGNDLLSENNEISKLQKIQELFGSYQKSGHHGPIDRTILQSTLDGSKNSSLPGSKRLFDETMNFPTDFMIKIVGQNEPTFVPDMLKTIAKCLNQTKKQDFPYSTKTTGGEKYISLTVKPFFQNSDELYATYAAIGQDKRVKMTL